MLLGKTTVLMHAKVAVLRHGYQGLEHVRSSLGTRQKGVVAQQFSRYAQITLAAVLQVQAHQVDHAVAGFFQLRAQKLGAKVARNLNHAFRRLGVNGLQLGRGDDAVLYAVGQRLLEERASVKQRYVVGCRHARRGWVQE